MNQISDSGELIEGNTITSGAYRGQRTYQIGRRCCVLFNEYHSCKWCGSRLHLLLGVTNEKYTGVDGIDYVYQATAVAGRICLKCGDWFLTSEY